jgi:hypothetical protein
MVYNHILYGYDGSKFVRPPHNLGIGRMEIHINQGVGASPRPLFPQNGTLTQFK